MQTPRAPSTKALCEPVLYWSRQLLRICRMSASELRSYSFKRSSRRRPLKLSMKEFWRSSFGRKAILGDRRKNIELLRASS